MAFYQAKDWHEGEKVMHQRLRVPENANPSVPMLSGQAAMMLQRGPLLAVGTTDFDGHPWTTVWGGDKGFARSLGNSVIGIRTPVAARLDPVIEALVGFQTTGEIIREEGSGRLVSMLSIDLETRKRVKLAGRMVAGALDSVTDDTDKQDSAKHHSDQASLQLVVKIEESLGNCPKYLNKKSITPAATRPRLVNDTLPLSDRAIDLVHESDLFFMSTAHSDLDMDTNHRGGPSGFVRVLSNNQTSVSIVYPEYSGNRLYQSLGNLLTDPRVGLCFPHFETGACLYLSGTAKILVGEDAAAIISRSNLAVKISVQAARLVEAVLPFRGSSGEVSPYNPRVRLLTTEKGSVPGIKEEKSIITARLLKQTPLTPTISKFRFSLSNPTTYSAGQYVTLDFSEHLDIGYSHMRNDDPRSLNDDYIRTFTVSSPPGLPPQPSKRLADDEFEITIRRIGVVTDLLFKQGLSANRPGTEFEVDVKGFDGSFSVKQDEAAPVVGYVSAGVGITPLLPSLSDLDLDRLRLLWSIRLEDVALLTATFEEHPKLAASTTVFLTSSPSFRGDEVDAVQKLAAFGALVKPRRMVAGDLSGLLSEVKRWYVCTGNAQRTAVLEWLEGQEVVYEDYNF